MEPASPPPRTLPSPRGSPTANRIALGRPVPLPLNLAMQLEGSTAAHSAKSSASLDFDSPPPTAADELASPSVPADSPTTPDPAAGAIPSEGAQELEEVAQEEEEKAGPSMVVQEGAAAPAGAPEPSSSSSPLPAHRLTSSFSTVAPPYATRRASSKLPASASTTSLGARTVLGYTSSTRRAASPFRSGSGASTAPPLTPASASAASGMASSSRFLLTVVPPGHLPHDPPHPRTNPQCSGYGPPEHFRRGTLVPLYPTLSSQLAAIAREYGLPSTGGLVLYLLSTTNPATQQPFPQAAGFAGEGGPRISDGAWNLLWSQLIAEEEAEREMLAYQQHQREHELLDSEDESDDEDYHPPPVPPIPSEHAPRRQRQVSEDAALFSDEQERVSQSSDAGASGDGSVYSALAGAPGAPAADGKAPPLTHRASAIARAGLGRGPPPSALSSPAAGAKRFTSLPAAAPPSHARHSSRHSLRSVSQRASAHRASGYGYPAPPTSARATSYGSSRLGGGGGPGSLFAPSLAGSQALSLLPGYGAAVVVGKVEFDIHAASRQGKWYEGWLASAAAQPATQPHSVAGSGTSGVSTPAAPTPVPAPAGEQQQPWQELHLPSLLAAGASVKTPQQPSSAPMPRGLGIDADEQPHADELATPYAHPRELADVANAPARETLASAALSSVSLAAAAGHSSAENSPLEEAAVEETAFLLEAERTPVAEAAVELGPDAQDEDEQHEADSSIVDKLASRDVAEDERVDALHPIDASFGLPPPLSRAPSSLPSRPVSNASTLAQEGSSASERGTDDTPLMDGEGAAESGYAPLADEEDEAKPAEYASSVAGSDDSRYGRPTEEDVEVQQEEEVQPAQLGADPLADVFQSDEATWQDLAADDSQPRLEERDMLETTGLGITGTRNVAELEASAAPVVLERRAEDETLDERGLPPPQDDVRDVMAMLSTTPTTATHPTNLASPIRLGSSAIAASETGVFPPSPREVVDRAEPEGAEERTSPFLPSHSTHTSISTVNFTVRPPSTIASMSPEFVATRKQRQGWTNVPPVIDPSLSASSSLSSIAPLASDSARSSASAGLMENLDDLERALAELSPRASARSRMASSPATILEEATEAPAPGLAAEEAVAPHPPRTSSHEQSEEGEVTASAAPVPPPSLLASRPTFRYRTLGSISGAAGETFAQAQEAGELAFSPAPSSSDLAPPSPAAEAVRIPRSSSLHKPEGRVAPQAHLVALPPSPLPGSIAAFAPSPDTLEEPLPPLPSASPSWPAAPPLPPSPSLVADPFAGFGAPAPQAPPAPPLAKAEDAPVPPPRSPGPLKGFRAGKWGSRSKSIDAGKANAATAAAAAGQGDSEPGSSGAKSPLGAFFGKFGKGDKKGFFRRGDSNSPEPPIPSSVAASDAAPELPALPPRQASLDVGAESFLAGFGRPRRPSVSASEHPQPPQQEEEPLPPFPPALAASPVQPALSELTHAQQRNELFGVPAAPAPAPALPAPEPSTSLFSAAALDAFPSPPPPPPPAAAPAPAAVDAASVPLPFSTGPGSALSSPRASLSPTSPSFFPPGTPRAPTTPRYPASAPVTPAAWALAATTPRTAAAGARKAQRLSADIDLLLSQMHEIDFLDEAGEAGEKEVRREEETMQPQPEEEEVQQPAPELPMLVEPEEDTSLAYDGGEFGSPVSSASSAPLALPSAGLLPPTEGARPLSEDLRALGGLMTGLGMASPPTSPEQAPPTALAALA
ncbi:hypothetical protein JCM10450v2_007800 [Rhodotorula kratochvilovae]